MRRVALTMVVALGLAGGQAKRGYSETKVTDTITVVATNAFEREALLAVAPQMRADIGIDLQVDLLTRDAYNTKTMVSFAKKTTEWDLVVYYPGDIADYAEHFAPLEQLAKEFNVDWQLSDIANNLKKTTMYWDGTLVGMPLDGDVVLLFYNKKAFTNPQLSAEFTEKYQRPLKVPETWEEFDRLTQFFAGKNWSGTGPKAYGTAAAYEETVFAYFAWRDRYLANSGTFLTENLKPEIASSGGVQALEAMIATLPFYPPGVLHFRSEEPKSLFISEEIPMLVSWSSTGKRIGDSSQSKIADQVGYAPMPGTLKNGSIVRGTGAAGRGLAVSKYSAKREAAARALAYLSSPAVSLKIVMNPKTIMDPWRLSHFSAPEFRKAWPGAPELLDMTLAGYDHMTSDMQIRGQREYFRVLSLAIAEALQKKKTAAAALTDAAASWEKISERHGRAQQQKAWAARIHGERKVR